VGGEGRCGTNWPTEVVEIATLCEFYENNGFFTTSCDPYMGHTYFLQKHFTLKGYKGWLLRKMPKVIIKLDKMLKD
jgi:hypothetical protein